MTEKMIRDAYSRIRTIDNTIPDDVLDFMKDAAIEKLRKYAVSSSVCPCNELPDGEIAISSKALTDPNWTDVQTDF